MRNTSLSCPDERENEQDRRAQPLGPGPEGLVRGVIA
jgi:hypothetical protein